MINKKYIIKTMNVYGDFIIDFLDDYTRENSICATIDFSNKYIRSIRRTERFSFKGNILVFDWTNNCFKPIPIRNIKKVTPLSTILNNKEY
jgi:hypothetical protein